MSDWPAWNYWMYDENGKFIYEHAFNLAGHADADFLDGTEYEDEWSQKFFWTPEEAAALSFGRSPNSVAYDQYMRDMGGSSEFATYFCELRQIILNEQQKNNLADPIPSWMYADWATRRGLPFPPDLAKSVSDWFKRVMAHEAKTAATSMQDAVVKDNVRSLDADPDSEIEPQYDRVKRTLLAIIYALTWKHYGLGKQSATSIAQKIETLIDIIRQKNPEIEGKYKTIAKRLEEALQQFGEPPQK